MSLLDDLKEPPSVTKGPRCQACIALEGMGDEEAQAVTEAIYTPVAEGGWSDRALAVKLTEHEHRVTTSSLMHHRQGNHRPPA